MEQLIRSLKARCAVSGTNITQLCKEAGVSRSTIERWKIKPPKSIQMLEALEAALAKKEFCPGCMGTCVNCEKSK